VSKKYDLAVKTGEYQDRDGNTKGRWQNVGAVMEDKDGGMYVMLSRTFNPAGLPNPKNSDVALLSCFEPKGRDDAPRESKRQGSAQRDLDEDSIPF
jgi:hypothetical protein